MMSNHWEPAHWSGPIVIGDRVELVNSNGSPVDWQAQGFTCARRVFGEVVNIGSDSGDPCRYTVAIPFGPDLRLSRGVYPRESLRKLDTIEALALLDAIERPA